MDKMVELSKVTPREKEILKLLARGFTTKQIGLKLNISALTVKTHRKNLIEKLGCKNCPELIYKASQIGLI